MAHSWSKDVPLGGNAAGVASPVTGSPSARIWGHNSPIGKARHSPDNLLTHTSQSAATRSGNPGGVPSSGHAERSMGTRDGTGTDVIVAMTAESKTDLSSSSSPSSGRSRNAPTPAVADWPQKLLLQTEKHSVSPSGAMTPTSRGMEYRAVDTHHRVALGAPVEQAGRSSARSSATIGGNTAGGAPSFSVEKPHRKSEVR